MIQVAILPDLMGGGVQVAIRNKMTDGGVIWAIGFDDEWHTLRWEYVDPEQMLVQRKPTLSLTDDVALALRDELNRHFGDGETPDNRAHKELRSDYLGERGRVDTLTSAIIEIARNANPPRPNNQSS